MPRLFMFYVGGMVAQGNIEVHDVQFVAADTVEQAFPVLAERWFGEHELFHVDSYAAIDWADGFDVTLQSSADPSDDRLYFINMGGYVEGDLQERHQFDLFVAKTPTEAKLRAKQRLLADLVIQHRDNMVEVDGFVALSEVQDLHVHLAANPHGKACRAEFQGYLPIAASP